jgi:hypothetical protein
MSFSIKSHNGDLIAFMLVDDSPNCCRACRLLENICSGVAFSKSLLKVLQPTPGVRINAHQYLSSSVVKLF